MNLFEQLYANEGIVQVTRIDPAMRAQDDNIVWLRRKLLAPLLADIPHQRLPDAGDGLPPHGGVRERYRFQLQS